MPAVKSRAKHAVKSAMLDKYRALNQIQRDCFIFSNHHEKYTLAT